MIVRSETVVTTAEEVREALTGIPMSSFHQAEVVMITGPDHNVYIAKNRFGRTGVVSRNVVITWETGSMPPPIVGAPATWQWETQDNETETVEPAEFKRKLRLHK